MCPPPGPELSREPTVQPVPLSGSASPGSAQAAGRAAPRRLRSDAERNRRRILAAAAEVFAEHGLAATLDDVAGRAGVGVGTVYRRFPDKEALIGELLEQQIGRMAQAAADALADEDPWTGLVSFIEYAVSTFATNVGLRQLLMTGKYAGRDAAFARRKMHPVVARLLRRAQAAGQVRADLQSTDIPLIAFMLGTGAEYVTTMRPEIWRRYLALILDGIRPSRQGTTPLVADALDPEEMELAFRGRARGPASRRAD